jgi:hypothetical protein
LESVEQSDSHYRLVGGTSLRCFIPASSSHVCQWFWERVLKNLDQLNWRISSAQRQQIISTVAQRVAGPPTAAEIEDLDRQQERPDMEEAENPVREGA